MILCGCEEKEKENLNELITEFYVLISWQNGYLNTVFVADISHRIFIHKYHIVLLYALKQWQSRIGLHKIEYSNVEDTKMG